MLTGLLFGQSLADKSYLIPRGNAGSAYRDALKRLIATENIDLLIPNNDTEVAVVFGHAGLSWLPGAPAFP